MVKLSEFLEKMVCADGSPIEPPMSAYRMDCTSSPNMRDSVGLGTCNCCDYFTLANQKVILIEETKLISQIKNLLKNNKCEEEIRKIIKEENRLKVYGSLLVLCRLARRLNNKTEAAMVSGVLEFYLVVSDDIDLDNVKVLDHFKHSVRKDLLEGLRGVLTRAAVDKVGIVWASQIGERLPAQPASPAPL